MKKTERKKHEIKDIYLQYAYEIYKYVYTIVGEKDAAEDIVQNTFIKAYFYIDKIIYKEKIRNWLIKVARNESLSFLKKKVGFIEDIIPVGIEPASLVNIEGDFLKKELHEKIKDEVKKLEQPYKEIVTMRYYKKMSFIEIAESMNVKPKKIYKMHERVKEILKKSLTCSE